MTRWRRRAPPPRMPPPNQKAPPSVPARQAFRQNTVLPFTALAMLAFFGALYWIDVPLYTHVISLWSFVMTVHPWIDATYVNAQVECFARGVDVYVSNPCDELGRVHIYSPLWLRLWFLSGANPIGRYFAPAQEVAFALSLSFLPAVRGRATPAMLAAMVSPTTVFAMERDNVDLSIFVLTVIGLACLERGWRLRIAGYAAFLAAGLLKFYPMVLFARALERQPKEFAAVAAASSASVLWFVWRFGPETRRALANVPTPIAFGDGFSSHQMGDGIGFLLGRPGVGLPVTAALDLMALMLAWRVSRGGAFAGAFGTLRERERGCLVAGALLFCGCFATLPSVGYRAISLLFVLPGCLAMARAGARVARLGVAAMLLAMWNFVPMMALGPKGALGQAIGPLPFLAVWVCREALWWIVFSILLAILLAWARRLLAENRLALPGFRRIASLG